MSEISKTADKALAILIELSDGGSATPQQLSQRMKVNRTVVQRLLMTLLLRGFVRRHGGEYALAPQMSRLAEAVQPELRQATRVQLSTLSKKFGETVVLQILDGDEAVVLAEKVPTSEMSLQVRHDVGSRSPIDSSASGLAILALLPEAVRDRLTRDGVIDARLHARLDEIRAAGFAQTSDELQTGVSGLAVPFVMGEVVASIAILVPTLRAGSLLDLLPELQRHVARSEAKLRQL
ncbi:MAG TPA: IclR family transcriptional regulator C-terminal domain-containing protein [Pseudolysinimonas sp.]|nr:IclR family transcriptional regulator C-terminal domain-containing protein [Pseudolysinimonas sp.]